MTHAELIEEFCKSQDLNIWMLWKEPTLGARQSRNSKPDVLAINKSWANYDVRAFEIKVKQSDLNQDVKKLKFENYRPWSHRISFVLGPDVKEDCLLPHPVGIIKWTKGGFHTKRSAPKVEAPTDMTKSWDMFHALNMGGSRFVKPSKYAQVKQAQEFLEIAKHKETWDDHYRITIKHLADAVKKAHEAHEGHDVIYQKVKRQFAEELKRILGIDHWGSLNTVKGLVETVYHDAHRKIDREIHTKFEKLFENLEIDKKEITQ